MIGGLARWIGCCLVLNEFSKANDGSDTYAIYQPPVSYVYLSNAGWNLQHSNAKHKENIELSF